MAGSRVAKGAEHIAGEAQARAPTAATRDAGGRVSAPARPRTGASVAAPEEDSMHRTFTASLLAGSVALVACAGATNQVATATPSAAAAAHCDCPEGCADPQSCEHHANAQAGAIKKVSVPQAAELASAKKATLVDVNGAETRAKLGVVPGAVLLSGTEFDAKELPADKQQPLVFYCASLQCGASHKAAERAVATGWTDVAVMPEGIKGWVDAGQPTQKH
jgi:rhodanese-related sulfurtransferase